MGRLRLVDSVRDIHMLEGFQQKEIGLGCVVLS
jgi:hypothetical protein